LRFQPRADEDLDLTTFEYLAIAYTLLFSTTALRLVGGLPHAFRRGRVYWVHSAFVVVLLCATVQNFWTFLVYRDLEWTFVRFLGMLAIPGNLYFIASMLIPDEASVVESWKKHYFQRRVQAFSGILAWGLLSFWATTFLAGMPFTHPVRGVQAGLLMMGICGLSSARPIVHELLAGFALTLLLVFGLIMVVLPIPTAG
jgi:hypothetical protein